MNQLTIIKQDGSAYIDSRAVAEVIGKNHKELLRDIRRYCGYMANRGERKIAPSSFFVENSYLSEQNKVMPCYLLSKMGCELVANKLTGEKGVLFTAAYITKFNQMEQAERKQLEAQAATPRLRVFNKAVKNVLDGLAYTHSSPKCVHEFLHGVYRPFGIVVAPLGDNDHTLTVTDIARILNLYSENGLPHGRAVAAIIDRLNVAPEHIEIAPYGLVGISVRYDYTVLDNVAAWIVSNGFPRDIPHLDFEYHIYYGRQLSLFDDDFDNDAEIEFDDDDFFDDDWFGDEE
jgi:Rha family phage regulatory protein